MKATIALILVSSTALVACTRIIERPSQAPSVVSTPAIVERTTQAPAPAPAAGSKLGRDFVPGPRPVSLQRRHLGEDRLGAELLSG